MDRGSADEAVLAVKLYADEDAVTYPRIKHTASDMDVGGKGWNREPRFDGFISNYRRETSRYWNYL